ncbi:DNA polymerase delta catalytic subunit [Coemansia sp. RSA 1200]|nr:DNA polymerase delta catalytic subunit [Coemansia sp. RSA 1200]
MAFDIEVYSGDSGKLPDPNVLDNRVFIISISHGNTSEVLQLGIDEDEKDLFHRFNLRIIDIDPDIIIGYNIFGFDIPYLISRGWDIQPLSRSNNIPSHIIPCSQPFASKNAAGEKEKAAGLCIPGRLVIDVMRYLLKEHKLASYALKNTSMVLGSDSAKLYLDMDEMFLAYRMYYIDKVGSNAMREVVEYAVRDSEATLGLWYHYDMWSMAMACSKVMHVNPEVLWRDGESVRALSMMVRECYVRGFCLEASNVSKFTYPGGMVMDPVAGLHTNVAVADFDSLYPSIIISKNICWTTFIRYGMYKPKSICEGIIPAVLKKLVDKRKQARQDGLKYMEYALKISANSIYGVLGGYIPMLNHTASAAYITQVGRELLEDARRRLESRVAYNTRVLYGDTDSCMFVSNDMTSREDAARIINSINTWSAPINLSLDNMFKAMLFISKKRYIAMDFNEKITMKGVVSVREDISPFSRVFFTDFAKHVLNGRDPIVFVSHMSDKLHSADPSTFVMTFKATSASPSSFSGKVRDKFGMKQGQTMDYVYALTDNKNSLISDRIVSIDSEGYVPSIIDREYYVKRELLAIIQSVLDAMDMSIQFNDIKAPNNMSPKIQTNVLEKLSTCNSAIIDLCIEAKHERDAEILNEARGKLPDHYMDILVECMKNISMKNIVSVKPAKAKTDRKKKTIPNKNKCTGIRKDGERCGSFCTSNSKFCISHSKGTSSGTVKHANIDNDVVSEYES